MNRLFAIGSLLFALCVSVRGAVGDITGVSIHNHGWSAYVYIDGFSSNTVFNNGFLNQTNISGTNEVWVQLPSTTNGLELSVSTPGFRNGVATTNVILAYGTEHMRLPWPGTNTNDVVISGGIARIRVALSERVFTNDTVTAAVRTNGFVDGSTPCVAVSGLAVTNESIIPHPSVVPTWTVSGWTRETNSTMRLSAMAFHDSGIDSAAFIVSKSGLSVSNWVGRTRPDRSRTIKGKLWADYGTDIDISGFSAGDQIRCDYRFWPKRGDSAAHFSTTDNLYGGTTSFPASITNFYDPNNNLTPYIAVVDLTAGASPAATNTTPENVNSAHYFGSWTAASIALLNSNNYNGGVFYVRNGQTNCAGTTVTYTNAAKSHVIIRAYPGHSLVINEFIAGTKSTAQRTKIEGAHIAMGGTDTMLDDAGRVWLWDCTFDCSSAAPIRAVSTPTVAWIENCRITNYTGGLFPFAGTEDLDFVLIGNDLGSFRHSWQPRVGIGNILLTNTSTNFVIEFVRSAQAKPPRWQIVYNNHFVFYGNASDIGSISGSAGRQGVTNLVLAQNVFEGVKIGGGSSGKAFTILNGHTNHFNIIIHNNTMVGYRTLFNYAVSNNQSVTHCVSIKNNSWEPWGFLKDDDPSILDGTAIGNWAQRWMVGTIGNAGPNTTFFSQSLHQDAEYYHLRNYYRPGEANRKPVGWFRHINRGALGSTGSADPSAGNGNYNYYSDSPVFFIPTEQLYDFDIDLYPRSRIDPPGSHAGGNRKKGLM